MKYINLKTHKMYYNLYQLSPLQYHPLHPLHPAQGFIIPANVSLWGKWAPVSERSMFIVYALSGTGTGVVFSMFTAGFLCGLSTGWPLVNYVYG